MKYNTQSEVEKYYLKKSGYKLSYPPTEKIKSIVVDNFLNLGKITTFRFIEWVQKNPGGVVSLPTGKTPEYFIKWMQYYLKNWTKPAIQKELAEVGVDPSKKPDMKSLYFVQIDEFYPISPKQHNSFYYYINKFYVNGMGFDKKKCMLIDTSQIGIMENYSLEKVFPDNKVDLSLRIRPPRNWQEEMQKNAINAIDQFTVDYEEKIRELGGIGFFLGGIGPDGHIGFNICGSDHYSTTRLIPINYETAAAAATDLGGVENSRNRLVITIGLQTIGYREDAVAIIIAAGEAKAKIVKKSMQSEKSITYPATALQNLDAFRFYLTTGSSLLLRERNYIQLQQQKNINVQDINFHIINHCIQYDTILDNISEQKLKKDRFTREVLKKSDMKYSDIKKQVKKEVLEKLEKGMGSIDNSTILHTAPHHDDIMLGYLPRLARIIRRPSNRHHFAYMTSGFTSVTNLYMLKLLNNLKHFMSLHDFQQQMKTDYFNPDNEQARNADIFRYLDGIADNIAYFQNEALAQRLMRILREAYNVKKNTDIIPKIDELIDYLNKQYPGQKDKPLMQKIKGMIREYEAELVWGRYGFDTSAVKHLRLGFYTGDIFTKQPEVKRDALPVLKLIKSIKPNIITVALDPEASGPDTHYKVLQAISEALKIYQNETGESNIKIWGYRNVWFRFHPADANIFIPVSLNTLSSLNDAFLTSFLSQKDASFPSYEYDGPFSSLAQQIQVEQYKKIRTLLGRDFFYNNYHPMLRATRGMVFLKELTLEEFYQYSMDLKKVTEIS